MATNDSLNESDMPVADQAVFRTFKLSMYSSVFMLSMTGNIILICAIFKFRKLRTVPNYLVMNLSVCDLIVVVSSIPFQMAYEELGYFPFGPVGCKVLWPLATSGINSGVLTMVAIAVERFKAINSPMTFHFNKSRAFLTIAATHIVGVCSVIPYSLCLRYSAEISDCGEIWSRKSRQIYTLALFLMQYAIPLPVIITLYFLSWNKVREQNMETIRLAQIHPAGKKSYSGDKFSKLSRSRRSAKPLIRKDSSVGKRISDLKESFRKPDPLCEVALQRYEQTMRTLKMFIAVVVVFAVCVLPNQITWLWTDFSENGGPNSMVSTVFYFLTYTNSVFNPWIYGGFNPSFRQAYKRMIYDKGILPIMQALSCISQAERITDPFCNSKTDVSAVYKLKPNNSSIQRLHEAEDTIIMAPNPLCLIRNNIYYDNEGSSSHEGSHILTSDFGESLRKKDSGYSSGGVTNHHDSPVITDYDTEKCTNSAHNEHNGKVFDATNKETAFNYTKLPSSSSSLHPQLEDNDIETGSVQSFNISDESSTGSFRRAKRQVKFLDEERSSAAITSPNPVSCNKGTLSYVGYEDIPYSVDIDLLKSMRETDC